MHNHDDFTFSDLQTVLHDLSNSLQIDLKSCVLQNIEFGVNIRPPIPTKDVLRGLLLHRNYEFKNVSCGRGDYRQVEHQRYYVKAYDKALQNNLDTSIFRFELKFRKMIDVHQFGIYTLGDLLTGNWIPGIQEYLINLWREIMYFDKTIYSKMPKSTRNELKLSQWSNPNYWQQLPKQQRYKEKLKYLECEQKYSAGIYREIEERISDKWRFFSQKGLPINTLNIGLIGHCSDSN